MRRAIVLTSGGMDSLVTTAYAKRENDELYLLHFNYKQLTEEKELSTFKKLIDYFQPKDHMIINLDYLKTIGGSSLVDTNIQVPLKSSSEEIPNTYVPFRNAQMLTIAVAWAEVIGAQKIYIGAVEEDSSGYPDCREIFYEKFNETIRYGTKFEYGTQVITPIIHLSKEQIIKLGKELQVPFENSWSCYCDNEIACGECDSCQLRIKAFKTAGMTDPIPYRTNINWLE